MNTRWRAIGRARGYSRRALHVIGVVEVRNRHRARWVLPPWEPLEKGSSVVHSRCVAGVVLPTRCVLVAQRMRGTEHWEAEGSLRAWRQQLRGRPVAMREVCEALADIGESGYGHELLSWPGEEWTQ